MKHTRLLALLGLLTLALIVTPAGVAAPPSNDDLASATVIAGLPFSTTVGIAEATTQSNEPLTGSAFRTVWYSLRPTSDLIVKADLGGSDYVTAFMAVYREDSAGFGGLAQIASGSYGPSFTFRLQAGMTYYIQAGDGYPYGWVSTVGINLEAVGPPPNDNFADAEAFTSVPFSDSPDLTAATVEPGEPMACGTSFNQSAWYAFTPTTSGSYGGDPGVTGVNVYTGTSLADLTSVACSQWWGLAFHADAGTTYYLQYHGGGMRIGLLPPPTVDYYYHPVDPSTFDTVSFGTVYFDPTVIAQTWDFGDGTTGSGANPSHRYSADGDYNVTLTHTTVDGRTGSQTRLLSVRTHDVRILSLVAPAKGRVGRQGVITVGLGNTQYPETVQVDLYKVTPQGDVFVGTSVQHVGLLKPKKTVNFSFNYVFTNEDATIGELPFRAVATIHGARDAANGDNTATSPPTLVTR
jgi:PKD repeat protein